MRWAVVVVFVAISGVAVIVSMATRSSKPSGEPGEPVAMASDAAPVPDADYTPVVDKAMKNVEDAAESGELAKAYLALEQVRAQLPASLISARAQAMEKKLMTAAKDAPPEGWRNTRWGMSKSEIEKLYPSSLFSQRSASASITFHDQRTSVRFHFQDDRLAVVAVGLPMAVPQIRALVPLLHEKYGPHFERSSVEMIWATTGTRVELRINDRVLIYRSNAISWVEGEAALTREQKLLDL